jgi:hypothetical protein
MNLFLATLDNNATPPVSGTSTTGNVSWPSPFKVITYTNDELALRALLFGPAPDRFTLFVQSIQFLWLVENSVLAHVITETDPLITYNTAQLVGQLTGISQTYLSAVDTALANMSDMNPSLLTGELLDTWNNSLAKTDKLAAVVAYFGTHK